MKITFNLDDSVVARLRGPGTANGGTGSRALPSEEELQARYLPEAGIRTRKGLGIRLLSGTDMG